MQQQKKNRRSSQKEIPTGRPAITPLSRNAQTRIRKLHQKKHRQQEGVFLAEGLNALEGALRGPYHQIEALVFTPAIADTVRQGTFSPFIPFHIPLYECSEKVMQSLSTEESPQGILLICNQRDFSLDRIGTLPDTLLYLDRVADPGNIGTIIRTAAWFRVQHIILSPSCVDPFNTKSIRTSAGTVFGTEIFLSVSQDRILEWAYSNSYSLIATVPHDGIDLNYRQKTRSRNIILLGQEAGGLSPALIEAADERLSIPGGGTVESLNLAVAAGIVLYAVTGKAVKSNSMKEPRK